MTFLDSLQSLSGWQQHWWIMRLHPGIVFGWQDIDPPDPDMCPSDHQIQEIEPLCWFESWFGGWHVTLLLHLKMKYQLFSCETFILSVFQTEVENSLHKESEKPDCLSLWGFGTHRGLKKDAHQLCWQRSSSIFRVRLYQLSRSIHEFFNFIQFFRVFSSNFYIHP